MVNGGGGWQEAQNNEWPESKLRLAENCKQGRAGPTLRNTLIILLVLHSSTVFFPLWLRPPLGLPLLATCHIPFPDTFTSLPYFISC